MELADLLAAPHTAIRSLSHAEWTELSEQLINSVAVELGVPLVNTGVVLPDVGEVQPGLILSFQSAALVPASLGIRLEGVAGIQSDPDTTSISASVFPFLDGRRVQFEGHDYYELALGRNGIGAAEWDHRGWLKDAYDEFEHVSRWGELSD